MVINILIAVLIFGVLIFIHELGHFLSAKWAGMQVNEFAMGMGPTLFSFGKGETKYSLRLFPIGGFVAVEGDDDSDSENPRAFGKVKLYKRIVFVVAGAFMNLVLGFLILLILSSRMTMFGSTIIGDFADGAVSNATLQVGDEITHVNGHRVRSSNDLLYEFMRDRDGIMDIKVNRAGESMLLGNVEFAMQELEGGIRSTQLDFRVQGIESTTANTVTYALNWCSSTVKMVWGSFVDLITGRYGFNQMSGPVGVSKQIGEVSAASRTSGNWQPLFYMMAFISVNLGVFNLLPLPALDGGRLLFLLIELLRRKPMNPKYEGWVHATGFMLLIGLMLVVTFNDIVKLF